MKVAGLLAYLRAALGGATLGFAEAPTPVSGGYDTQIYTFRLVGAPPALSGPLVLRVLGPQHDPRRALREQAIQNAVANQGYPAPRAPLASADPGILGTGFLIMERLPGRPLLEVFRLGLAGVLVKAQGALHTLDPTPVLEAVEKAVPGGSREHTAEGQLARMEERVVQGELQGLTSAVSWLRANRPSVEASPVVCHGDFHPQNVLVDDRRQLTGVLDWPNLLVAERAADVAASRVILRYAPVDVTPLPPHLHPVMLMARVVLVSRFLAGHRRAAPLSRRALRYYEALACMRGLVRAAEQRTRSAHDGTPLTPLDASRFAERLAQRFARLTRVRPVLPEVPAAKADSVTRPHISSFV